MDRKLRNESDHGRLERGLRGEGETRLHQLNLVSLGFTLAGIGVLLLALATVVVLPVALNFLGLHNATDLLLRIARWPLLTLVIILGLAVLYRYGPSRRRSRAQGGHSPTSVVTRANNLRACMRTRQEVGMSQGFLGPRRDSRVSFLEWRFDGVRNGVVSRLGHQRLK